MQGVNLLELELSIHIWQENNDNIIICEHINVGGAVGEGLMLTTGVLCCWESRDYTELTLSIISGIFLSNFNMTNLFLFIKDLFSLIPFTNKKTCVMYKTFSKIGFQKVQKYIQKKHNCWKYSNKF